MATSRQVGGGLLVVGAATGYGLLPLFATEARRAGLDTVTVLAIRFTLAAAALWLLVAAPPAGGAAAAGARRGARGRCELLDRPGRRVLRRGGPARRVARRVVALHVPVARRRGRRAGRPAAVAPHACGRVGSGGHRAGAGVR